MSCLQGEFRFVLEGIFTPKYGKPSFQREWWLSERSSLFKTAFQSISSINCVGQTWSKILKLALHSKNDIGEDNSTVDLATFLLQQCQLFGWVGGGGGRGEGKVGIHRAFTVF